MTMLNQIKNIKDKVQFLISRNPELRDSDKKLWLAYMVHYEGLKNIIYDEAYYDFVNLIMCKSTPSFESLSRARRKVQEEYPHLAGDKATRLKESDKISEWAVIK